MGKITPVLIYGPPKTGTTLFKALLDGTDHIYVYPNEIKFKWYGLQRFKSTEQLVLHYKTKNRDPLKVPDPEKMNGRLVPPWDVNKRTGQFQWPNVLVGYFDFDCYYYHLNKSIAVGGGRINGPQLIYHDLLSAARATKGIAVDYLKYVCFKDVGGDYPRVISTFLSAFPQGKIILINRNPYAQFLSRLEFWRRYDYAQSGILFQLLSILRLNYFYKTLTGGLKDHPRIRVVKYEDLVKNTAQVMEGVACFLGVEYNAVFTQPTIFGMKGQVRTATETESGVFSQSVRKWEGKLTRFQKKMVTACTPYAPSHGYKHVSHVNWFISLLLSSSLLRKMLELLLPQFRFLKRIRGDK